MFSGTSTCLVYIIAKGKVILLTTHRNLGPANGIFLEISTQAVGKYPKLLGKE